LNVEEILYKNELLAIVFHKKTIDSGVHFYVENERSLQVGKQRRVKGEVIKPHRHIKVKVAREETLQEVLYIEKGKVKITFYTDQWEEIDSRILNVGDMILLIKGGHGFEMLEETEMIEIKQGPYDPEATKRMENN